MESFVYQSEIRRLFECITMHNINYQEVALLAEDLLTRNVSNLERAITIMVHAYACVRLDPHQHQAVEIPKAAAALPAIFFAKKTHQENREYVDYAALLYILTLQLVSRDTDALPICEQLLADHSTTMRIRTKLLNAQAYSLHSLGQKEQAIQIYEQAAAEIDALPEDAKSPGIKIERQRLTLNLADHYLGEGNIALSKNLLSILDERHISPMMAVDRQTAHSRIALLQQEWAEAQQFAQQARDLALATNYRIGRQEALRVLIVIAGRFDRRNDQRRLMLEYAALEMA